MEYPLLKANETYPRQPICPICGKNKVFEPHTFVTLSGGALLLDKKGDSISAENLFGFLGLTWHGHHYPEVEDQIKDTSVNINLVEDSSNGQFELYFCSINCLREFLNKVVVDFEREVNKVLNEF